jgi:hypothetical protein
MTRSTGTRDVQPEKGSRKWWILSVLCISVLLVAIDLNRSAFLRSGYRLCWCPFSGLLSVCFRRRLCGAARVPGCAPAPTAPGCVSFRVAGADGAGQAGGRAQSRCQQVRNASFQGQSGLIFKTRSRACRASRAGMCQTR